MLNASCGLDLCQAVPRSVFDFTKCIDASALARYEAVHHCSYAGVLLCVVLDALLHCNNHTAQ